MEAALVKTPEWTIQKAAASRVSKGSFAPLHITEPYPESSSVQAVNLSIHTALQDDVGN